ncbi:unnamed protein product [Linum trigynum]|uniref:Uncharacterized protein n=1 Tax=Linum trigynum TaxID=586398 RepID=A0AAV2E416_9ROSI
MAASRTRTLFLLLLLLAGSFNLIASAAGSEGLMTAVASEEWPIAMSIYGGGEAEPDGDVDLEDGVSVDWDGEEGGGGSGSNRRSLFWRRWPYYISYGALLANRIPCPARSGRSYYTNNCYKARTPVNPYSRGCSRITRCRA